MSFFNKVYHYKRKNSHYIFGWHWVGAIWLAVTIAAGVFFLPGLLLAWLFQMADSWIIIISFIFFMLLTLCCGFCVIINNKYVELYYLYFGIPFRVIKIERQLVKTECPRPSTNLETMPEAYIYEDCDVWTASEPTWVAIKYKKKEYEIGNSNNSKEILALVKKALERN